MTDEEKRDLILKRAATTISYLSDVIRWENFLIQKKQFLKCFKRDSYFKRGIF